MVGFCEHKLRSLRRNAARPAKLTGCKWLLSPRICRTYQDIPCRIRLSIASLLKISAFRKPRETQKPADYFSGKLFVQPIVFIRTVILNQASAGNKPRRLQAPELVSSVHCSLHSWRICDAIQQPFQRIKAGRHPQASLPPWRCGRFPAPPQAAAEQIDSQLPTEPALRRG